MNKLLRMAETLPDAPPLALPSTFSHSPDPQNPYATVPVQGPWRGAEVGSAPTPAAQAVLRQ